LLLSIPRNWKGKWDKWELGEVNDKHARIYRGKKVNIESKCWYNRSLGRRLYFGKFDPPPGLLDWERFGSPVPRYPFFVESGNRWIPKKPSHWMYPSQDSEAKDRNKQAEAPHPSRLPLVGGKEKMLVVEDQEMEDEEMISSEEEEGMEVDEFEEENPATNVVTIADTNHDISAQTFQTLTRDAFSISRARPLSIIRAQGLIWIRFEDVTASRRGFGALGAVWKKMQIDFRPNDEFNEAALYTTDVWLREEDFNENTPAPPYTPAIAIEQEVATVHLSIQSAVSASQAASERERPLAVSAPQAAPNGRVLRSWIGTRLMTPKLPSLLQGRQPKRLVWKP
jgi:hypothetical protein